MWTKKPRPCPPVSFFHTSPLCTPAPSAVSTPYPRHAPSLERPPKVPSKSEHPKFNRNERVGEP